MSSIPTHPAEKLDLSEEEERIIRERLLTFDRDEQEAKPWSEVKARIIEQLKAH